MANIRREMIEDGIFLLTLDRADAPANVLDFDTLAELEAQLDALGSPEQKPRGLIITSARPAGFAEGAPLGALPKMNAEEVKTLLQRGQSVFNKLAALPFPTVAAVHGSVTRGAYELCLACDWRVASSDPKTRLGLPETKLGLIPAWGGCTRLPRLLSVPKALDIILDAQVLPARLALRAGLVDEVVPREHLVSAARRWLERGKQERGIARSAAVNAMVDAVIAPGERHDVRVRSRGNLPALEKALNVVLRNAAAWDDADAFEREREAAGELIASEATRHLLHLHFLEESARKFSVPGAPEEIPAITRAAVIGAGPMGSGTAQWLSAHGVRVILRDADAPSVAAGMGNIAGLYATGVRQRQYTEREARAGRDRISPAVGEVPLKYVDLVIEAAVEDEGATKEAAAATKELFRRLDAVTGEETILAMSPSALSISDLAASTRHPARVIGLHFFNPVHKTQLVEVISGKATSPAVAQRAVRLVQRIGKLPVLVKDSPGFLVNRILAPYLLEACAIFWAGAEAKDVDAAMRNFGMPMGPLRLIDEIGANAAMDLAATLSAAFPARLHVPDVLPALQGTGMVGRKAGKGFYKYRKGSEASPNKEAAKLRPPGDLREPDRAEIEQRLVLLMVNEAARCLEEGVAATAGEIDLAMVLGAGFAPFHGGPLRYADSIAVPKVAEELTRLTANIGPHYTPCALLAEMAKTGKRFYEP